MKTYTKKTRSSAVIAIPIIILDFYFLTGFFFPEDSLFGLGFISSIFYFVIIFFFHSGLWKKIAGEGKLNIIPTIFLVSTAIVLGIPLIIGIFIPLIIGLLIEPIAYATAYLFFPTAAFLLGAIFEKDEKMPKGQYVIVLNHSCYIDTIVLIFILGIRKWSAIVGQKMKYIPPMCFFLWGRVVYVNRNKKEVGYKRTIFNSMCEKVNQGYNFVVFAEGTRYSDGLLHSFKDGAFNLAVKTKTPILTVVLKSPWIYCPKTRWYFVPSIIDITYLSIIETENKKPEEVKGICYKEMSEFLQKVN